jgi:hypothetical protein
MKQNNTKYHQLYLILDTADDYFPKEQRKELLTIIKELYETYLCINEDEDNNGKYGISYTTIHDDSRYHDHHKQFFSSLEKRDLVYEDWSNGLYYDNIFKCDLEYPTPGPNFGNMKKIFKERDKIYDEQ